MQPEDVDLLVAYLYGEATNYEEKQVDDVLDCNADLNSLVLELSIMINNGDIMRDEVIQMLREY